MRFFKPWMFPVGMMGLNIFVFTSALMFERRLKIGVLRYMVLYALTIPAAMRGDMEPFYVVLNSGGW